MDDDLAKDDGSAVSPTPVGLFRARLANEPGAAPKLVHWCRKDRIVFFLITTASESLTMSQVRLSTYKFLWRKRQLGFGPCLRSCIVYIVAITAAVHQMYFFESVGCVRAAT
jgi:hypothetical protein